MLIIDDSDDFVTFFVNPFMDRVPLFDDNKDDLRRLNFILDLLFLRFLKPSSEYESEPDGVMEGWRKN